LHLYNRIAQPSKDRRASGPVLEVTVTASESNCSEPQLRATTQSGGAISAPPLRFAFAAGLGSERLLVLAAVCCATAMRFPTAMRCRRMRS
jgi:hypothetical protein